MLRKRREKRGDTFFFFFISLNKNSREPRKSTRQWWPVRLQLASRYKRSYLYMRLYLFSLWPARKDRDVILPSRNEIHAWCNPRIRTCRGAKKGITRKQQRRLTAIGRGIRKRRKRWWWRSERVPKSTAVHYGDRMCNSSCLTPFKWPLFIARR